MPEVSLINTHRAASNPKIRAFVKISKNGVTRCPECKRLVASNSFRDHIPFCKSESDK